MLPIPFPFVKYVIYDDLGDLWQKRFRELRDSWQPSPTGQRPVLPRRRKNHLMIRVHSWLTKLRWTSNEGTLRASVMLTVSQLSKSFAGRALFDDVSLQANRGDRIKFQS